MRRSRCWRAIPMPCLSGREPGSAAARSAPGGRFVWRRAISSARRSRSPAFSWRARGRSWQSPMGKFIRRRIRRGGCLSPAWRRRRMMPPAWFPCRKAWSGGCSRRALLTRRIRLSGMGHIWRWLGLTGKRGWSRWSVMSAWRIAARLLTTKSWTGRWWAGWLWASATLCMRNWSMMAGGNC